MPRNFDRRIEVVAPVEDPQHRETLRQLVELMLEDNRQAWDLLPDGTYRQRQPGSTPERGTHRVLMERYRELSGRLEGQPTASYPVVRQA
jgi:polyphosphate kinase